MATANNADSDGSICYAYAESDSGSGYYLCTLATGHEGPHEAQTPEGHTVARWAQLHVTDSE